MVGAEKFNEFCVYALMVCEQRFSAQTLRLRMVREREKKKCYRKFDTIYVYMYIPLLHRVR